jgi:peptidoglycan/xylan/chitin deacetylase (PgdA/CDA1 family)
MQAGGQRVKGKKELLARIGASTGATRLAEALPRKASLMILNYHRIGDAARTPYDSGTFSATTAEFEWQVQFLKRRYRLLTLFEALDIVHNRFPLTDPAVLLTFDDGYRDNYDEAFSVLRRHGVSATFFVPTAFVGTGVLPWWDVIAYLIKNASTDTLVLRYPAPAELQLSPGNINPTIMQVLRLFKQTVMTDPERFLFELEAACGATRPGSAAERCFLNWEEAREMQAAGMCFGSHTHTHPILSKLSVQAQTDELVRSRQILEAELSGPLDTLAYPVGQRDSFSPDSFTALRNAGYSAAFSFYSGVNRPGAIQPYNILRGAVEDESRALFRLRVALKAVASREL